MTLTDPHTLTGAFALHALPDDERVAFESHLTACASCAQEAAEFTATAARLASAAAEPVRPAVRKQVLQRVTTVRQVPPGAPAVERVRRRMPRGSRPARWALAACVAAAAALGGTAVWQYDRAQEAVHQAGEAERHAEEVAGVLAAPDAKTRSVRVAGGTGTLVVSARRDRAVFVASGMTEPPRGKVYQLWFADGGKMRSAGLMRPDRRSQSVLMQGRVDGTSGVGITVEPAGGSPQPTSAPIGLLGIPS
ncbi:anti-sigma factor [Streptomyces sp. NRRL B-3648]|uniref:anti-sigma factor n=1 Tax=Streptomyces sp. NRRL B-3648 TaxID=1519493 RepID=UPI0006AE6A5C|nr:anti-sigma factor [Streptomyces sp. NRRL B-3648]KOX11508.1 anti-sigma factor [Streptomyces sp. NRRL B-3648]